MNVLHRDVVITQPTRDLCSLTACVLCQEFRWRLTALHQRFGLVRLTARTELVMVEASMRLGEALRPSLLLRLSRGSGYTLFLTANEAVLSLPRPGRAPKVKKEPAIDSNSKIIYFGDMCPPK